MNYKVLIFLFSLLNTLNLYGSSYPKESDISFLKCSKNYQMIRSCLSKNIDSEVSSVNLILCKRINKSSSYIKVLKKLSNGSVTNSTIGGSLKTDKFANLTFNSLNLINSTNVYFTNDYDEAKMETRTSSKVTSSMTLYCN